MITNIRKWDLMEGKNSLNSEEACIWYTKKNKKGSYWRGVEQESF
jgi:hypothetical protein